MLLNDCDKFLFHFRFLLIFLNIFQVSFVMQASKTYCLRLFVSLRQTCRHNFEHNRWEKSEPKWKIIGQLDIIIIYYNKHMFGYIALHV